MAEDPSIVCDVNREIIVEPEAVVNIIPQTVKESNTVTNISQQTLQEPMALRELALQNVEELNVGTDITKQTVDDPNAVADITKQTVDDPNAVIDITKQTVDDPNAVIDITKQTVEEQEAEADITKQTVDNPNVVVDITKQTVEEQEAVADIAKQIAEGKDAVADIAKQIVQEPDLVADITKDCVEEPNAIAYITKHGVEEEQGAKTDITKLPVEERSSITDSILHKTEAQSAEKDDTQETTEKLVTQQTVEPSVIRDTSQRKFGYVQISWETENFFFVTKNDEWEISSPEFEVDGFCVTRWRLILKVKKNKESNNQDAFICLERLDGENDTRNIRVCWNVWYKIGNEKLPLCDRENLITSKCYLAVMIKNFESLNKSLQVGLTTICLEGLILVRSTENGVAFKRSEDVGVKRLSEDISTAYSISQHQSDIKYESFSDLKINTEGYPLICHKPILSARNKVLNETIDKNSGRSEIDFNFSEEKAGKKILQYLYSGNLTHILRMPSVSIDKAINYLGMDELKCYYLKDSVNLLTRYEAEDIYFKWIVMDINSSENFLYSPIFSRENSRLALRLRLGLNKDVPESAFLSLKLDVIGGNNVPEFYFISGIVNNNGQIVSRRAMQWTSDCEKEIVKFASKSVLRDTSITGKGHLAILCSVFIPKGTKYQSVVKVQKCLRHELDHERHYRLLSTELTTLFETSKHADLYIKCQGETFKVHKCVLFARSPVFRRAIRQMKHLKGKKSKGFSMHDFDPKVLRIILRYIYSGILNCAKEDALAVYEGSKKLSMVTLQNQLYDILLNAIDVSNAIETLELAVENADFRLVGPVCCFIMNNIEEIKLQKNWEEFVEKKEFLYEKLNEYARDHSKVRQNV